MMKRIMTVEQIQVKLKSHEYDFLRTDKRLSNNIIILVLGGSYAYGMPFVLRCFLGGEVTESDRMFYHEGLLAKFVEIPHIEVDLKEL